MTNDASALVGRILDDRYQLEARVGRGGMGQVFRARHLMMDQRVAVKILEPDLAQDPDAATRFVREAKTTFRLNHPNCVRVTDLGATDDGLMYLVMEYLDGRTVGQELSYDGPMAPTRVVHIATQVCHALDAAHEMGLIHRDLKPDNMMLVHQADDPDVVKVLDFGLAKIISDRRGAFTTSLSLAGLTHEGVIFGTPEYMSPEQAMDDPLTPRSDLYALGVVIYEMLTGNLPFHSPNQMEILAAHVNREPEPPATKYPGLGIPGMLSDLVIRLMAKSPAARPENARALVAELDAVRETLLAAGPGGDGPRVAGHVAASSTVDLNQSAIARAADGALPPESGERAHREDTPVPRIAPQAETMVGMEPVARPAYVEARETATDPPSPSRGGARAGRAVVLALAIATGVVLLIAFLAMGESGSPSADGADLTADRTAENTGTLPLDAGTQAPDAGVIPPADAGTPRHEVEHAVEHAADVPREQPEHPVVRGLSKDEKRRLETHLASAEKARAAGNVLEQMAHADSALRIDRDNARAAYLLGDALTESDPARACRYLRKARKKIAKARKAYRDASCSRAD